MVQTLRLGSSGPAVSRLQQALNAQTPPARISDSGQYDALTREAVRRFQQANWLVADGEAGQSTQAALFNQEAYEPILHSVPFIAQTTINGCWLASTAMLTNSSIAAVLGRTPNHLVRQDGALENWSHTDQALSRGQEYGRAHGLRCFPPQSYLPTALKSMLESGPLMFDMLWDVNRFLTPDAAVPHHFLGSAGHLLVVVGIRGDDDASGKGTTLRIYDPWPVNAGAIYSVGYAKWLKETPLRTYRVFQR